MLFRGTTSPVFVCNGLDVHRNIGHGGDAVLLLLILVPMKEGAFLCFANRLQYTTHVQARVIRCTYLRDTTGRHFDLCARLFDCYTPQREWLPNACKNVVQMLNMLASPQGTPTRARILHPEKSFRSLEAT